MKVTVNLLRDGATLPARATQAAAAFDVFADLSGDVVVYYENANGERRERKVTEVDGVRQVVVHNGLRMMVPTGVAIDLPEGYEAKLYGRSGLGLKHGITLANAVGVIDEDYTQEVFVCLINNSPRGQYAIKHGDRIAQMQITKRDSVELVVGDVPHQKGDRVGGLGSTGVSTQIEVEAPQTPQDREQTALASKRRTKKQTAEATQGETAVRSDDSVSENAVHPSEDTNHGA